MPERAPPQFDLFAERRPQRRVLSVSELTREVKALIEGRFGSVWVEGEISNLKRPGSGHLYFTLKDEGSSVPAVLFRSQARLLKFQPTDGQRVLARGRLTVYEPQGAYQLACDALEPLGAGALMAAFEQLKAKLAAEGLFDPARKRPLPRLPRKIGVVTSTAGAAIRDFLRVLHRRFPNLPVLIFNARVQGDGASSDIAAGIRALGRRADLDVVVVTRGGGSIEDLWAFNEEPVARALAACPIPTVSAVGHEIDFTIADFAADVRAPTPTAAAELIAPVKADLALDLQQRGARLRRALTNALGQRRDRLDHAAAKLRDPRRLIADRRLGLARLEQRLEDALSSQLSRRGDLLARVRTRLDAAHPRARLARQAAELRALEERLRHAVARALQHRAAKLGGVAGRLESLSPLGVLSRGYALAFSGGHLVSGAAALAPGARLRLRFADGAADATVDAIDLNPDTKEPPKP